MKTKKVVPTGKAKTEGKIKKKMVKKDAARPASGKFVKPAIKSAPPVQEKPAPYIYAVGRRKEAAARVHFFEKGDGKIVVNGRDLKNYFPNFQLFELVLAPLQLTGQEGRSEVSVKVSGGGKQGQAEAVRHGIARALVKWNADLKPILKKAGFLTRDPRAKERKKFGLKKARKAPQWAKR